LHINKSGKYVLYQNEICRLVSIGCVDDDLKEGFYIIIKNDKLINSECIEWLGKKIKPANLEEIDNLYEISHYVCFDNRKFNHYWASTTEELMELFINCHKKEEYKEYDLHEIDRGEWVIRVPKNEVTLYETKTYYDKDKFINEDERVVLSEETYLIDEPWWLEETKDN